MPVPALQNPIRRLGVVPPQAGSLTGYVTDVRIVHMTPHLALFWQNHCQSIIDSQYKRWGMSGSSRPIRADVGWKWYDIWTLAALHSALCRRRGTGRALALCMLLDSHAQNDIPIGMLTVVPRFFTDALGVRRLRTFAWYLADAPVEYFNTLGRQPVKGIARALVDCAVQAGYDDGQDGTLLLHADPNGGQKLTDFYANRLKMTQLPSSAPRVSTLRWANSEEHFHWDAAQASQFCTALNQLR